MLKDEKLKQDKNIYKDINLLKSQAQRCKEILQKLSLNPLKLKDKFLNKVKLTDLIKINFDKFNKTKQLQIHDNIDNKEPEIIFKDEIMYALGNIIQNSINYSKEIVSVKLNYSEKDIKIEISDDGLGFPKDIVDKLGEPYISKNNEGMGLGIFIAKNLIENMGGSIHFFNSKENYPIVEITFDNSILGI